ncbi:Mitochondrial inner membrane i-AAA protease complex subunit MGR1 [Wickerhamomyces ciferrii]|uniref:Mitochondrial inner membrane i-AAA protease complex subunit MGR1 n=1 Tax=Wickerhamomyces ciferrii (strain ATCC 14091 / BCRC 22168 / CBS 111 / JCM 3599 / NBRC 0793 / NRRL Y-1031 F-60-10) TaxID=1206466 RepID=K0KJQ3_WICCF|nr:Mitochondrial inner membrane i-AAA protease complex subunit MGR1 [Wickerhamomyces ciferrii]CCH41704.1 Mitochondrial inner membrane i-AAA protease complex subunit MGR1 [Wickerhamomyces ciferrii]
MGLFIPPNSDKNKDTQGSQNPSSDSNKTIFYTRPSVGLKLWGPLVPASDYLPGIYGLTALQTLLGLTMFRHTRIIWRQTSLISRISKIFSTVTGSYLIFNSGLEISRLIIPYDPWYEEAKSIRNQAIARGEKPNFWFGPLDYKPMSFKEWSEKVDDWVEETESQLNQEESSSFITQNPQFHQVYKQIRQLNKERNLEVLKNLKTPGMNEFLGLNNSQFINPEFDRPNLTLPDDNNLETNLDFLEVWELNDPWESLGRDTDYVVRFIPKYRWFEKLEELQKRQIEDNQEILKKQIEETLDEREDHKESI